MVRNKFNFKPLPAWLLALGHDSLPQQIVVQQRKYHLEKLFKHDCSTLGGNSGSSVIDLETNQVIGLHFGGRYLQGNSAVALWELTNDRLLKKGKVQFIS